MEVFPAKLQSLRATIMEATSFPGFSPTRPQWRERERLSLSPLGPIRREPWVRGCYGRSGDKKEILSYLVQRALFVSYYYHGDMAETFQRVHTFAKSWKVQNTRRSIKMADGI